MKIPGIRQTRYTEIRAMAECNNRFPSNPIKGVKLAENLPLSVNKIRFGVYLVSKTGGYNLENKDQGRQNGTDHNAIYMNNFDCFINVCNNLGKSLGSNPPLSATHLIFISLTAVSGSPHRRIFLGKSIKIYWT